MSPKSHSHVCTHVNSQLLDMKQVSDVHEGKGIVCMKILIEFILLLMNRLKLCGDLKIPLGILAFIWCFYLFIFS